LPFRKIKSRRTSFEATRIVCLEGALTRPCTFGDTEPRSQVILPRFASTTPGKGMEDKDNPSPNFSGETTDWPP